ncbi:hypothetical protein M1N11_05390 [Peptococcaceae bacterium]|nr:hypothetical protein [Peptococcaceae bacterium]
MFIATNQRKFKLLAVVVVMALVVSIVMPVGAAQAQENSANVTKVQKIETIIRFEQPLTLTEVDKLIKLIKQHKITPIATQYIAIDGSFNGGFGYKENLFTSLSEAIVDEEKEIKEIKELIKQETDEQKKQIMKRMLNIREKVLETLKNQSFKINSLQVIVEKDDINKIQRDVQIADIQIVNTGTTCTKYPSSESENK